MLTSPIPVFQTTWSLNHGIDASEILREFPDELRGDVSLHMHREMLSLPIFETAPQGMFGVRSEANETLQSRASNNRMFQF